MRPDNIEQCILAFVLVKKMIASRTDDQSAVQKLGSMAESFCRSEIHIIVCRRKPLAVNNQSMDENR